MSAPSIREWAIAQGYKVGERGRFSKEVLTAYSAAFPDAPTKVVKVVSKPRAPKPEGEAKPVLSERAAAPAEPAPVTRPGAKSMLARFKDRMTFRFDSCTSCSQHVSRCACDLPKPPCSTIGAETVVDSVTRL